MSIKRRQLILGGSTLAGAGLCSAQHCWCIPSRDCDGKALQEELSAARFSCSLVKALPKLLDEVWSSLTKHTQCLYCKRHKVIALH